MASLPDGTGDHGAAGKTAPTLLCAPRTAEKEAEFATGELGLGYCNYQHRILPLREGKDNPQKLWG